MSYLNRHSARRTHRSAELMYLLVVLAAGVATAWWMGHRIGMDLSSVTTVASVLGLTDTGRMSHGAVGYTATGAQTADANTAPFCAPGQAASFAPSVSVLVQHLGSSMGTPVECEHTVSPGGDTQQQTTTGLVAYNKSTNVVSFTDGWRHWANTPRGFVTWEGTRSDPPAR